MVERSTKIALRFGVDLRLQSPPISPHFSGLLFIEPPLRSLLGGASANSRALTFTCRSHPITVIGTVMIRSPPEAQRLSALVSRLAADHGRATSCKQEPRGAALGGSRRESTSCLEPADERLHCASLQEARRCQGPDGAWRSPPISRALADAGLRSAALARRGVPGDPSLSRCCFTKSLRCWRGLCARLGDGLRRKGSNHERRRRQRWQEGQESHLALFDRQAAAPR